MCWGHEVKVTARSSIKFVLFCFVYESSSAPLRDERSNISTINGCSSSTFMCSIILAWFSWKKQKKKNEIVYRTTAASERDQFNGKKHKLLWLQVSVMLEKISWYDELLFSVRPHSFLFVRFLCNMDSGRSYRCSNTNMRISDVISKSFSIGNTVRYFHSKFQVILIERYSLQVLVKSSESAILYMKINVWVLKTLRHTSQKWQVLMCFIGYSGLNLHLGELSKSF